LKCLISNTMYSILFVLVAGYIPVFAASGTVFILS
jgi:hypothetical protein